MEKITLVIYPMSIVVADGQEGRLWYQAPGLEIYVCGAVSEARLHAVHYMACLEASARHIPLIALKCVYRPQPKQEKVNPNQKDMFK